jgi:Xaa-Pro aminopeptidase
MVIVLHPYVLSPTGGGVWIGKTSIVTNDGPRSLLASVKNLKIVKKF